MSCLEATLSVRFRLFLRRNVKNLCFPKDAVVVLRFSLLPLSPNHRWRTRQYNHTTQIDEPKLVTPKETNANTSHTTTTTPPQKQTLKTTEPPQVLGASKTGAPVLIVDCPSLDLLPSLVENPAWDRLYATSRRPPSTTATSHSSEGSGGGGGGPVVGGKKARKGKGGGGDGGCPKFEDAPFLVHMAPEEVLRSPAYGEWARRFGPTAKHLVATKPFCSPHSIFQVCVFVCVCSWAGKENATTLCSASRPL